MKIDAVIGMFAYTDTGERISVREIEGPDPKSGMIIEKTDSGYAVTGNADPKDEDCVGGVCPIK